MSKQFKGAIPQEILISIASFLSPGVIEPFALTSRACYLAATTPLLSKNSDKITSKNDPFRLHIDPENSTSVLSRHLALKKRYGTTTDEHAYTIPRLLQDSPERCWYIRHIRFTHERRDWLSWGVWPGEVYYFPTAESGFREWELPAIYSEHMKSRARERYVAIERLVERSVLCSGGRKIEEDEMKTMKKSLLGYIIEGDDSLLKLLLVELAVNLKSLVVERTHDSVDGFMHLFGDALRNGYHNYKDGYLPPTSPRCLNLFTNLHSLKWTSRTAESPVSRTVTFERVIPLLLLPALKDLSIDINARTTKPDDFRMVANPAYIDLRNSFAGRISPVQNLTMLNCALTRMELLFFFKELSTLKSFRLLRKAYDPCALIREVESSGVLLVGDFDFVPTFSFGPADSSYIDWSLRIQEREREKVVLKYCYYHREPKTRSYLETIFLLLGILLLGPFVMHFLVVALVVRFWLSCLLACFS